MGKAHDSVRAKGRKAFLDGKPRLAPYVDSFCGSRNNIVTGARGYIRAWEDGWDRAKADRDAGVSLIKALKDPTRDDGPDG